jgi:hypothetical protein
VWYFIIFGLLALYVIIDGSSRKLEVVKTVLWAIGTFLLGVVVLPIYIAKRPLKANQIREGGFAWNVLKNFALTWTILMVAISIRCGYRNRHTSCRVVFPNGRCDCTGLFPQELGYSRAWAYRTFGTRSKSHLA